MKYHKKNLLIIIVIFLIIIIISLSLITQTGCRCPAWVITKYYRNENTSIIEAWHVEGYEHSKEPDIKVKNVKISIIYKNETVISGNINTPRLLINPPNTSIEEIYTFKKNKKNEYFDVGDQIQIKNFDYDGDGQIDKIFLNWQSNSFINSGFNGWIVKFNVKLESNFLEQKYGQIGCFGEDWDLFNVGEKYSNPNNENQTLIDIKFQTDDNLEWSKITILRYNYPPNKSQYIEPIFINNTDSLNNGSILNKNETIIMVIYEKENKITKDYPILGIFYDNNIIFEYYL